MVIQPNDLLLLLLIPSKNCWGEFIYLWFIKDAFRPHTSATEVSNDKIHNEYAGKNIVFINLFINFDSDRDRLSN